MNEFYSYSEEEALLWFEGARSTSAEEAENALTWLSNIGSGAASGATTGLVAGPWGALVGALVGGALGAAQTAASQQQQRPPPRRPAPRPAPPRPVAAARPTAAARRPPPPPAAPAAARPSPAAGPLPPAALQPLTAPGPVSAPPAAVTTAGGQSVPLELIGQVIGLLPGIVQMFSQQEALDEGYGAGYSGAGEDWETAVESVLLDTLAAVESSDYEFEAGAIMEVLPGLVDILSATLPSILHGLGVVQESAPGAGEDTAAWESDNDGAGSTEPVDGKTAAPEDEFWGTPEWNAEVEADRGC